MMPWDLNNAEIRTTVGPPQLKELRISPGAFQTLKAVCLGLAVFVLFPGDVSHARHVIDFKGVWDPAGQKVSVEIIEDSQRPFYLEIEKASLSDYDLYMTVTNWTAGFLTLSTVMKGSLKVLPRDSGQSAILAGRLVSTYTLVNQIPVEPFAAEVFIRDRVFDIQSFRLGDISGSGRIIPGVHPVFDFAVQFDRLSLADLAQFIQQDTGLEMSGVVSGDVRIQGPSDKLQIRGRLNAADGSIAGQEYNAARINFTGIYPMIYVDHSYAARADGMSFDVQGTLDFSEVKDFRRQLEAFTVFPMITRRGDDVEWIFKRMKSDSKSGTTELKYLLKRDDNSGQDVNLFGVQRRMEF